MDMTHDQFVAWLALEGFELKTHKQCYGYDKWRVVPMEYPSAKAKEDPTNGYYVPVAKCDQGIWVLTDDAAPHHYVYTTETLPIKYIQSFRPELLARIGK